MTKPSETRTYLPYLDSLRAIAAVYVVLHHTALQYKFSQFEQFSLLEKISIAFFSNGHLAVDFFIVLSGFCLSIPLVKKNDFKLSGGAGLFFKKRTRRILIPYFFALTLSLVLIWTLVGAKTGTHWDISLPVTGKDIWMHVFLIHDIFGTYVSKINHALWSVSVECRIYLFFPLLVWVWRKYGSMVCLGVSILISVVLFIATGYLNRKFKLGIDMFSPGVNPYIVMFVLGMIAANISLSGSQVMVNIRNNMVWIFISITLLIGFLLLQTVTEKSSYIYWFEFTDVLFGFWSLCFLVALNGNKLEWLRKILSVKPLVFVGTFAYSIYLIHAPLIQVIWQYLINPLKLSELQSYYMMLFLGTTLIVIIAWVFYLFCERPFLNEKNNFFKRKQNADALIQEAKATAI